MSTGSELLERYSGAMVQVFGTPQLVIASGHGCWVTDVDGKRYLDLLSGIAVNALGHGHPALVQAVAKQAESAIHVSNFFTSEPAIRLAERLLVLARAPRGSGVFFANSGTEATEAAIKLSRRTGRSRIVALEGSFHGRTTGALALTHKAAYREPFEPLIPDVVFVPAGDEQALRQAVDEPTAAVFVEPVQGEAGVRELTDDYLRAAREVTHRNGALLVLDEIQTGIGRTGKMFGAEHYGLEPELLVVGKGISGGVGSLGGVLVKGEVVEKFFGGTTPTSAGNAVSAAAGKALIDTVRDEKLVENSAAMGEYFTEAVWALKDPWVGDVRFKGLLGGVELVKDRETKEVLPKDLVVAIKDSMHEDGILLTVSGPLGNVLRLQPPLTATRKHLDACVAAMRRGLEKARASA